MIVGPARYLVLPGTNRARPALPARYIPPYIPPYTNNKNVLLSWMVFLAQHEVIVKSTWSETWKALRT
jgi:hypothetical protein